MTVSITKHRAIELTNAIAVALLEVGLNNEVLLKTGAKLKYDHHLNQFVVVGYAHDGSDIPA
jgi:hypothetical protein